MKILFLEPFFGGSHKDFALGFKASCRHAVTLMMLPDRFWKWRMRGAAVYFVNQIIDIKSYDLILATDMLDLTDFIALAGKHCPPVWLYFHENQLDYPLAPGEKRDFHLGFTNIVSALAADRVFFNSTYHQNTFFTHAERLISKMPDYPPAWVMEQIKNKSRVTCPGCRFTAEPLKLGSRDAGCPLIIWNHRWEHDKNPEPFFKALARLEEKKISFSLALLGENFSKAPAVFEQAKKQFKHRLVVSGYLESRKAYVSWLKKGAIVVSCANQENFGISVVEAVRFGCIPLLPHRLSYPEIIPEKYHSTLLYKTDNDLETRLENLVADYVSFSWVQPALSQHMARFAWQNIIRIYHALLPPC